MAKHLLPTTCFETAFVEYLRLRFEFEPLMHYAMAALHVCDQTSREYPDFVKGFLAWFATSFLFDHKGGLPAQGHQAKSSRMPKRPIVATSRTMSSTRTCIGAFS